jgi:opacity protein-like surface antigen
MKKSIVLSVVLFMFVAAGYSQHLSVNAFGGYTFRDKINFNNAYTYINEGGMWGASIEGVNAQGTALEVLYQYQSTATPTTIYIPSQTINSNTVISYLLLNFEQYYLNLNNPKIQPYGGLGLGAAFYKSDYQGSTSETKFAWDIKAGVKFKMSSSVGIKIGAQLLSSSQATGNAFYYGYVYTTYATILQFSFTGGLVFDLGGH